MRKDNKTVEKTETLKNRVIRIGRNILFVALGCVAIGSTVMLSEKQHVLDPFNSYSIKAEDETITLTSKDDNALWTNISESAEYARKGKVDLMMSPITEQTYDTTISNMVTAGNAIVLGEGKTDALTYDIVSDGNNIYVLAWINGTNNGLWAISYTDSTKAVEADIKAIQVKTTGKDGVTKDVYGLEEAINKAAASATTTDTTSSAEPELTEATEASDAEATESQTSNADTLNTETTQVEE